MQAPLITIYARVIDNLTGKELLGFDYAHNQSAWYYGKCNSIDGGESQYIVEFDIWNNERGFNAGMYDHRCQDAKRCRLNIWPNQGYQINNNDLFNMKDPFMYARCLTTEIGEYQPIDVDKHLRIIGNVNPNIDSLKGSGDHAIVQTKIIIPPNSNLENKRYDFSFSFYYDCD